MQKIRYSKQREAIKSFLLDRKDHPTAEVVYINIKKEYPNISLGTVYRNLTLLSNIGEIVRLQTGDGVDHFDATTTPHYHFICKRCDNVIDLDIDEKTINDINKKANKTFNGKIDNHTMYFYGICKKCLEK